MRDGPRSAGARIGVVGADLPRQIVLASGGLPVRIFGDAGSPVSARAQDLLGAADPVAGRILDVVLEGRVGPLDALVICNDSAADLRLFYVLRILAERRVIGVPVHLLDAPRGGGAPRDVFVTRQYSRLAEFCGSVAGTVVGLDELRSAGVGERSLGAAAERMRRRRVARECSGVKALDSYRHASASPLDEAIAALDAAVDAVDPHARALFVTGSSHPDSSAYAELEAADFVVVGEDHDAGDAAWLGEAVDGDSVDEVFAALAQRHAARPPLSARSTAAERAEYLSRRVAESPARAVLSLVRDLDDAPLWDVAVQREALRASGTPVVGPVPLSPDLNVADLVDTFASAARQQVAS